MIQALKITGTGLATIGLIGAGVGIGVYFSICCLIFFAFNLGLIELADSFGILNSFLGISRLPLWFRPRVGKRYFSTNRIQPVKVYKNPDSQNKQIKNENRGKSGISMWTNKINGRAQKDILVLLGILLRDYLTIILYQYQKNIWRLN
jgi:hypothetical protein